MITLSSKFTVFLSTHVNVAKYVNKVHKILTNVPLGGSDLVGMIFDETAVVPKVSYGHRKKCSHMVLLIQMTFF